MPRHPRLPHRRRIAPVALLALAAAVLLLAPEAARAQECDEALLERIQTRYRAIESFQGRFTQTDRRPDGRADEATGKLAYERPGHMRWAYEPPHEQLLVTDGETVWLYDPLLDNVTVQPLGDLTQGTPLAFLLGVGNLNEDFRCRPFSTEVPDDGLRYVELVPRGDLPGLDYIQLGVRDNAQVASLRMFDPRGNLRWVRLEELRFGVDLPEGHFTFEVTDEMEVIRK